MTPAEAFTTLVLTSTMAVFAWQLGVAVFTDLVKR